MSERGRTPVWLVVVGVLALLAAGWFGLRALDERDSQAAPPAAEPTSIPTQTVGSRVGGFIVSGPADFELTRREGTVSFTSKKKQISISVGAGAGADLEAAHDEFVAAVADAYDGSNFEVTTPVRVNDQRAIRTVGTVRTSDGRGLVTTITTITDGRRTVGATVFTTRDVSPKDVLLYVTSTIESIEVGGR